MACSRCLRPWSSIDEAVKQRVKRTGLGLGEDPRDEASAAVESGLGLGNGGNAQDIHVEAIRLHTQAHVHASASGLARELDRIGADDVRVPLENTHRWQDRRITKQGAHTPVGRIQVAGPRAARPR